jgi:PAS domain S-box-containing protein
MVAPVDRLFYDAFNASPIGIALEDLEGRPLFVNPALCSMLGFSDEEIRNKHCVEFSPPEDAEKDWALFQQLRAGSIDHYQIEKRYFRKNGPLLWGRLSISLLNNRPSPVVVAMVEDITDKKKVQDDLDWERRRSEESLRESEERLRLAVQAGRMFAYSWDAATDAIERSGESGRILGIQEKEAATGRAIWTMVHPDDKERLKAALAKLTVENPTLQITYRIVRPDGAVAWLERNSRAYFNERGSLKRIVGMIVDVTERKQAENKLREYERAIEGSGEIICVVDRDYRYLIANRQFLKYRKMTKDQVVGRFASEVVHKGLFEAVVKPKLDECFQGKAVRYEMKYEYPDLGERDLSISYFPIDGDTGVDRAACIIQDITDRKNAEKTLAAMTRKLIEAQEQERARIGRELHDDINQRLSLLAVEVEAAIKKFPNSKETRRLLAKFRKRISEVSSAVQSISHKLHSSQLEYLGLVATMRSFCKEFALRRTVEIDFKSDNMPKTVPYELSLCLFRILQEALQNAAKHSTVRRFKVELGYSANELHLIVSDRGTGFEVETTMNKGGLGLISMRERVRLVNGTISIESKPMGGTTIRVRVPFEAENSSQRIAV